MEISIQKPVILIILFLPSLWTDNAFAVKNVILELYYICTFFQKTIYPSIHGSDLEKEQPWPDFFILFPTSFLSSIVPKSQGPEDASSQSWSTSSEKTIVSRSSIPRTALWVSRPKNFTSYPVKVCFWNLETLRRSHGRRDRAFISVRITSRFFVEDFRERLSCSTLSLLWETHEKRHLKRTITAEHYRAQSNATWHVAIKMHSLSQRKSWTRACLRERNLSLLLRYYTASSKSVSIETLLCTLTRLFTAEIYEFMI